MLNTFSTVTREINLDNLSDSFSIYLFGDIHRFVKHCDEAEWKRFLRRSKEFSEERPGRVFFLGMGDYDDFASTREKLDMARLHETTLQGLDELNEKRIRVLSAEMKHMEGKTLGLIEGNHHWVYENGTTSTQELAARLDTEYLGWLSQIALRVTFGESKKKSKMVYIVANHGKSGGKRAGAGINQVEDLKDVFPMADILAMGHNHQRGAWPFNAMIPTQRGDGTWGVKAKRQLLCRSGSFVHAYGDPNSKAMQKSYAVGGLFKPADLGAIRIDVSFRRDYTNGDTIVTELQAVT